jgi:predicted DNA-binding antitoxin AbrB/MazE fold protein
MSEKVVAIYEQGVLRPLEPLHLPECTRVQIQVITSPFGDEGEYDRVRQALLRAGIIRPRLPEADVQPVSEAQLVAAGNALAQAGPLSEIIIAERDGR